ncbi:hypothetical protein [Tahibacter amnicola]|uniref:Restriction endonuclease n=1 Tax=Tahibacter amnicola TaxID=2976241 RepID=A0ABY6BAF1_9GAMM|nr:hypothetical protein [Tahibacter amnicola]UXI67043.1 hypothetical protein N4264_20160 [Tahibacter amnicola]
MNSQYRGDDVTPRLYEALLNLSVDSVQVCRDAAFRIGADGVQRFAVFCEFYQSGVRHRVGFAVVDTRPVEEADIEGLQVGIRAVGDDLLGVCVSTVGFEAGARRAADRLGVMILPAQELENLGRLLASRWNAGWMPEAHCMAEPFWCIGELADDSDIESTGKLYTLPPGNSARVIFFLSRNYAEAYRQALPDPEHWRVYGMPQYKLPELIRVADGERWDFGIVLHPQRSDGMFEIHPISPAALAGDFLVQEMTMRPS